MNPIDETNFNRTTRELKKLIKDFNNDNFQQRLLKLTNTVGTDFSLWEITKWLNQPRQRHPPIKKIDGDWTRSDAQKAEMFAQHLAEVFTPVQDQVDNMELLEYLECLLPMNLPIAHVPPREVKTTIFTKFNPNKSHVYDLITGKILKKLTKKAIVYIKALFNAIIRTSHIPGQWKLAQTIMIPKSGKPPNEVTSYSLISLLPIMSKLFEKLRLVQLKTPVSEDKLIHDHQFSFRNNHSTIEQLNRVYNVNSNSIEKKKYCSAAFLDIQQAFDNVWHPGLLYKIFKSYLANRRFYGRHRHATSEWHPIKSGVLQGSVLGPVLYTLYTADLPIRRDVTVATYADDTAILAAH